MKVNSGVEWAVHACVLLASLPDGWALPADALAEFHGVPPAYMAKQMQALRKAGLVVSQRGAAGGYRLARAPADISLWDITAAIEGSAPAFRCTEIRQNGPCGASADQCREPCAIASRFLAAERVYRDALRATSLVEIVAGVAGTRTQDELKALGSWLDENAARTGK